MILPAYGTNPIPASTDVKDLQCTKAATINSTCLNPAQEKQGTVT